MAGIFKAYDIRGVVGDGLDANCAYLIGRGLAVEVFGRRGPIVVSRDMRTHSPQLADALIRGLSAEGCAVVDIGLAATPMNYWANVEYSAAGSVQVTASHNGPQYNGFKVSGPRAAPVDYASGLDLVERFVLQSEAGGKSGETSTAQPATKPADVLEKYLQFMDGFLTVEGRPLKIVVDAGNGMAGLFMPEFARRRDWLQAQPLYWELDGTFPNHEADPLKPENLEDVQNATRAQGGDFGVAFDGDADRCMFVDENGRTISSDLITALIAAEVLRQHPGTPILYDLRSSKVVPEWIEQHGGEPVRGRVGHSFMKRLLKERGAPFGGELSGHYYFADCFNTDSGLMAMIQLINIWQRRQESLSQMIAPLRQYSATGEINFRVGDVASVLENIERHYEAQGAALDRLDGLTVAFDEWWFNLRSSNTEPLLRLNLEAASDTARAQRLKEVQALIEA